MCSLFTRMAGLFAEGNGNSTIFALILMADMIVPRSLAYLFIAAKWVWGWKWNCPVDGVDESCCLYVAKKLSISQ